MSPGTRSAASTLCRRPSRSTDERGASMPRIASIACSARPSCTKPTTALARTTARITPVSTQCCSSRRDRGRGDQHVDQHVVEMGEEPEDGAALRWLPGDGWARAPPSDRAASSDVSPVSVASSTWSASSFGTECKPIGLCPFMELRACGTRCPFANRPRFAERLRNTTSTSRIEPAAANRLSARFEPAGHHRRDCLGSLSRRSRQWLVPSAAAHENEARFRQTLASRSP